jgi:hypothetical protein
MGLAPGTLTHTQWFQVVASRLDNLGVPLEEVSDGLAGGGAGLDEVVSFAVGGDGDLDGRGQDANTDVVVDLEVRAAPSNHHYLGCKRYDGSEEDRSHPTGLTIGAKKKIQMAKEQLASGPHFTANAKMSSNGIVKMYRLKGKIKRTVKLLLTT